MSCVEVDRIAADAALENRIADMAILLSTAKTPNERRMAWCELTRLHSLRSPARVAQMEDERGLS